MKKRVDVFALGIYGLIVFPKALGYIDEAVSDLFDRLDKRVTPVPVEKVSYRVFFENYSLLKELVATPRRDDISEEKWIAILRNRQEEDVELKQFVLATRGLAQCEFSYKGDNYKKKWWDKRVNDNIPIPSQENTRPIEEHLQVIPSELEIIKREFEKRNSELRKKIEQLEEEKMHLGLDANIHKLEAEKLRKGKNKVEEDLDSLKTNYKKLRMSIRTASLGKTSEQWRQEIKEEKIKVD
ncbi:hypothetical protein Gotur_005365 [Gossypium turneri]